jgi:hypothetical protein
MTSNNSDNELTQQILSWQIQDRRRDALAGLADAAERLRRLAEEMSTATRLYPKAEDLSKALGYAQNQITWGFANLLAAINDAAVKAYEADVLAATRAAGE